jgi:vacuolar-type H+-ATPase subunit E/Vma4
MTVSAPHPTDVLCAEILAEARRESEVILRHAQSEAGRVLAAGNAEAEKIEHEQIEQARVEAARREGMVLASIAVEASRIRAAHIEKLLESIRQEIQRHLSAGDLDRHAVVVTLATEAIRQMSGNDFILKICPADQAAFGEDIIGKIAGRARRSPLNLIVTADAAVTNGIIIESANGLQVWDNRLTARLERLWPELRRQIAIQAALVAENTSMGGGT